MHHFLEGLDPGEKARERSQSASSLYLKLLSKASRKGDLTKTDEVDMDARA